MPTINDWSSDDDSTPLGTSGAGPTGPVGPAQQKYSTQKEPQFTNWSRFTSANQDVSNASAKNLASRVTQGQAKASKDITQAAANYNRQVDSNYNNNNGQPDAYKPANSIITGNNVSPFMYENKVGSKTPAPALVAPSVPGAPKKAPISKGAPPSQQQSSHWGAMVSSPRPTKAPPAAKPVPMMESASSISAKRTVSPQGQVNPIGAKDEAEMMGAGGWEALTGAAQKADQEAQALGDPSKVQALLQNGPYAATARDAALISGAGGKSFEDIAAASKKDPLSNRLQSDLSSSQGKWSQFLLDSEAAKKQASDLAAKQAYDAETARENALGPVDLDPKQPAAAPKTAQDIWKDLLKDTAHSMTYDQAGKRNVTANGVKIASNIPGAIMGQGTVGWGGDAWDAASEYMKQAGVSPDTFDKTWTTFLDSLPPEMKNYVMGMVLGGNPGVEAFGDSIAPKNSPEDWAWFNQLFNAYLNMIKNGGVTGNGASGSGAPINSSTTWKANSFGSGQGGNSGKTAQSNQKTR